MSLLINLPAVTAVNNSDLLYVNQAGISKKMTIAQLITSLSGSVLTGLVIQDENTQISTTCTILNFLGPTVSTTMAGNKANITLSAQAGIQFKSIGTNLGTSGTATSFDSDPGISLTRSSNAILIGLEDVIVSDATTARTLNISDVNKLIRFTAATAITYTFNALSPLPPIGRKIKIRQAGAGQITLTAGGGVTLNAFAGLAKTRGQHCTIEVTHIGSNVWDISGQVP